MSRWLRASAGPRCWSRGHSCSRRWRDPRSAVICAGSVATGDTTRWASCCVRGCVAAVPRSRRLVGRWSTDVPSFFLAGCRAGVLVQCSAGGFPSSFDGSGSPSSAWSFSDGLFAVDQPPPQPSQSYLSGGMAGIVFIATRLGLVALLTSCLSRGCRTVGVSSLQRAARWPDCDRAHRCCGAGVFGFWTSRRGVATGEAG